MHYLFRLLAIPVLAMATPAVPAPRPPEVEVVTARIADDLAAGRYAEARGEIERSLSRRLAPDQIRELQKMRGAILLWEDRREEAMAAFAAAEGTDPASPAVALYELDLAFERRDPLLAMAAVDHLIERYPDAARMMGPTRIGPLISWMRQNERREQADSMLIRLALIGFGGNDFTTRDNFAMESAAGALAAGRLDDARELAARVHSRRELSMALIERRFSALWPVIEAQIGPGMAIAEAAAIRDAEALAAAHPNDVGARHGLMQAYYLAGRFADADRVGARFAATPAEMREIDETGGWFVNDHAIVLHAMGRAADADSRFAAMRAIDIEASGWLVSMVINRLEYLVQDGRWNEALALQDETARDAERHGSPYARQLVRRLRLCTLHGLGRTAEAEAMLAELKGHEADSPGATIDGLICLGLFDEAEPILVRWLERSTEGGSAVEALQPPASGRQSDPSIWTAGWDRLSQRPAVREAFARVGRIMPEAFWPRRSDDRPH